MFVERCSQDRVLSATGLYFMPKAPRGKRVADPTGESFRVVNKAPNGQAEPYFDRSRQVWVAPWRKPDGKVGKPTGKT